MCTRVWVEAPETVSGRTGKSGRRQHGYVCLGAGDGVGWDGGQTLWPCSRMQDDPGFSFVLVLGLVEFRPAAFKEAPHGVSCLANLRRVLVEELTVVEDQLGISSKLFHTAVASL